MEMRRLPRRAIAVASDHRRLAKSAFAAGLSWWLAERLFAFNDPYFAPLAAILTLQVTVTQSLRASAQRIAGVVVGVSLAALLMHFLTVNAGTVTLLIFAGLVLGTVLRMPEQAISQIAVSALLVAALGAAKPGYAWHRVIETAIGAAAAIAVNALIVPASHMDKVRAALAEFASRLGELINHLAELLRDESGGSELLDRARKLNQSVSGIRSVLTLSDQHLRWNYFGARERPQLEAYETMFGSLERVSVLARALARALLDTSAGAEGDACSVLREWPGKVATDVARLISDIGATLLKLAAALEKDSPVDLVGQIHRDSAARLKVIRELSGDVLKDTRWVWMGAMMADMDRMLQEIADAATALTLLAK